MNRRRALSASAMSGGGKLFPLFLDFDYCEPGAWFGTVCYRDDNDGVALKYYSYLVETLSKYGEVKPALVRLTQSQLDELGIHIYIGSYKITEIEQYVGATVLDFYTIPQAESAQWHPDGRIEVESK